MYRSTHLADSANLIGVFDSGLGGLSVLRALRRRLALTSLLYIADSAYAPYGERATHEVIARCEHLTNTLLAEGAQTIVVACNTATALAIDHLRSQHPRLPIVGVEPGIKPAANRSRNGRIGLLATPATIASTRLRGLVDRHAGNSEVLLQACPGLAAAIEQHPPGSPEVEALLREYCGPLKAFGVDTVVLGCTHYPLVAQQIQALMGPEVRLIDTAEAIAERTAEVHAASAIESGHGQVRLLTSGDPQHLALQADRWLDLRQPVSVLGKHRPIACDTTASLVPGAGIEPA